MCQPACKPGSVWPCPVALTGRGDHSSGTSVAGRLARPTRTAGPETDPGRFPCPTLSLFGLAPDGACRAAAVTGERGGLLPHPFTLAAKTAVVCFLWRFPLGWRPDPLRERLVSPAGFCPASCFHGARTFLRPPPFGIWQTAAARPAGAPDLGAWDRQVKQP